MYISFMSEMANACSHVHSAFQRHKMRLCQSSLRFLLHSYFSIFVFNLLSIAIVSYGHW